MPLSVSSYHLDTGLKNRANIDAIRDEHHLVFHSAIYLRKK